MSLEVLILDQESPLGAIYILLALMVIMNGVWHLSDNTLDYIFSMFVVIQFAC